MAKKTDLIQTSNFNVDFKPATIEIKNADVIKETIKEIANHYEKTVYAEDDLEGLLQSHKELNKLRKGLDESRKDVKREFNKPLKAFEKEIKGMIKEIDKPLNEIKSMRDEILDAQEEAREDALQEYLEKKIKDTGLVMDDIEQLDSWTNKGNWTEKLNPRKPLREEIERAISNELDEKKKLVAERKLLENFFMEREMDASGWVAQLEDKEATEIIQNFLNSKEKKENEVKIESDEGEVAEDSLEERQRVLSHEKEKTLSLDDLGLDEPKITNTIEVTGTFEQLSKLNRYLVDSGIKVKQID